MHYRNVIGIGPLEELTLQCNCVNLKRNREGEINGGKLKKKEKTTSKKDRLSVSRLGTPQMLSTS